jgi:glycosyltransferase involved in cell wall biosynthesis
MISIVIPHLNQAAYLDRCLAALAPQVELIGNTEVIVVDNGSKDIPMDVLGKYRWVRLERESVPGPGPARNRGIDVSHGDILAFVDADCVANRDWLMWVARSFKAHPDCEVIGGDVRIGLIDDRNPTMLEAYESVFAYRQAEYITRHQFSGTGNLAMRRAAYYKVGPFAGIEVAEDRDWGKRANRAKVNIKYVPEMIVYHPARRTFQELAAKWDRHISHDFNEKPAGILGRLLWIARLIAVALSAILDVRKIITSDRITSFHAMMLASAMLFRIRLYRAWRMLGMVLQRGQSGPQWNGK